MTSMASLIGWANILIGTAFPSAVKKHSTLELFHSRISPYAYSTVFSFASLDLSKFDALNTNVQRKIIVATFCVEQNWLKCLKPKNRVSGMPCNRTMFVSFVVIYIIQVREQTSVVTNMHKFKTTASIIAKGYCMFCRSNMFTNIPSDSVGRDFV